jgi:hypothetical protein
MAEPENHTLHVLRDFRDAIAALDGKVQGLDSKVDRNHQDLRSRLDNFRQAVTGESVLGRYAAAEERLEALEKRLTALEETQ